MDGSDSHHHHHHHHQHQDHDHGHGHDHHGKDQQSFTEKNRAHWDKSAPDYMTEAFQSKYGDLLNKITAFILENISWIGVDFLDPSSTFEKDDGTEKDDQKTVRFLDYACGPGTLTLALTGYASEYIGVDLSEKMVEQYNQRFSSSSSSSSASKANDDATVPAARPLNAHAIAANLLAPEGPPPELQDPKYFDFDLVAVGLGFHHFEHLEEVTRRLVERVKSGGVFMIVDFLPHQENDLGNDTNHIIAHHGFTAERVKELFEGAGLVDVDLRVMDQEVLLRGTAKRTPFLARGRKTA